MNYINYHYYAVLTFIFILIKHQTENRQKN